MLVAADPLLRVCSLGACLPAWPGCLHREVAAFPASWVRANKFWPTVGRIDNVHGDRNLICSCPPLDSYAEPEPLASVA